MRFDKIRFRGMGVFKHEVELDFTAIDGTLVAFCGVNGSGKSTILELLCGALYRKTPTHGTLGDLATARDAFVEVKCVNGKSLTIRQTIDSNTGKGEALVVDASGAVLVESAKVSAFDAWARDHITPSEVLYASSVAVQRSYGFLDLKRADRTAVLLRALGIERYERMARAAADAARDAKIQADSLRRTIAALPNVSVSYHRERLAEAERNVARLEEATRAARLAFQRAVEAAKDVARAMELAEQRRAAEKRLDAAKAVVEDLERRIAKNRELQGRAAAIRHAVERTEAMQAELVELRARRAELKAQLDAAVAAEFGARDRSSRAVDASTRAYGRVTATQRRLVDRDRVAAAVGEAERLRTSVAEAEAALAALDDEAEKFTALALEGKDRRITGLRSPLMELAAYRGPGCEDDLARMGSYAIAEDDALALEVADAPRKRAEALRAGAEAGAELGKLRAQLRTAEQLAARAEEIAAAQRDLETAERENAEAKEAVINATNELEAAKAATRAARKAFDEVDPAVTRTERQIASYALDYDLREHLARAEALIEERTAQLVPAREAVTATQLELAAIPNPDRVDAVDLGALERQAQRAEEEERAERTIAGSLSAAVETAERNEAKRTELQRELAAVEDELADWTRLAQDLGRDGLQALEIDAAVPELNTVANELLHSCHGTRFTVELRTDRLSSDGKKTIEDLEARVIDMQEGRDAEASTYSPGELVIVSEAIALAITTRACRQAGIERPTLIRDETGAALSAENGRAYIRMLRRAAQLIGADKVLYVSHSPELQELADVRVEISADHRISIGGQS